jgi:hypothetical protein
MYERQSRTHESLLELSFLEFHPPFFLSSLFIRSHWFMTGSCVRTSRRISSCIFRMCIPNGNVTIGRLLNVSPPRRRIVKAFYKIVSIALSSSFSQCAFALEVSACYHISDQTAYLLSPWPYIFTALNFVRDEADTLSSSTSITYQHFLGASKYNILERFNAI